MRLASMLAGLGALVGAGLGYSAALGAGALARSSEPLGDLRWRAPLTVQARTAPSCSGAAGSVRIEAPSRGFRIPPLDETIDVGDPAYRDLFTQGMRVRLTAVPGTGARFVGWAGACSHSDVQCDVLVHRHRFVVAHFCGSA